MTTLGADEEFVRAVQDGSALAKSPLHGDRHWRAVAASGLRLAQSTPGADREVIVLSGLFHDERRLKEGFDPDPSARAADLARELAPAADSDSRSAVISGLTHSDSRTRLLSAIARSSSNAAGVAFANRR